MPCPESRTKRALRDRADRARAGYRPGSRRGPRRLAQDGVEQLQRRSGAGQLVLRQVEIAHGGRDMAMAEQPLDGMDIYAGLQQVRGEGMATMPSTA